VRDLVDGFPVPCLVVQRQLVNRRKRVARSRRLENLDDRAILRKYGMLLFQ
jgi:hypothetical protein